MSKEHIYSVIRKASTVNYHMLKACNMSCGFCFATFSDIQQYSPLSFEQRLELVDTLCKAGFRKINFAGGEPTLCPSLPDLIRLAKSHGLVTSIATNGSRTTPEWLDYLAGYLDIVALSIDTVRTEAQIEIGRVERGKPPIDSQRYLALGKAIRSQGIRLKVNTVVNRANYSEDFRSFILAMNPERWKIFQALPVQGQNDIRINEFTVSDRQFEQYVECNRTVERSGIEVVPENNDLMTGSYVMVDPHGRFFDNVRGRHTYSAPILEVGVTSALTGISVDANLFEQRGGNY